MREPTQIVYLNANLHKLAKAEAAKRGLSLSSFAKLVFCKFLDVYLDTDGNVVDSEAAAAEKRKTEQAEKMEAEDRKRKNDARFHGMMKDAETNYRKLFKKDPTDRYMQTMEKQIREQLEEDHRKMKEEGK